LFSERIQNSTKSIRKIGWRLGVKGGATRRDREGDQLPFGRGFWGGLGNGEGEEKAISELTKTKEGK